MKRNLWFKDPNHYPQKSRKKEEKFIDLNQLWFIKYPCIQPPSEEDKIENQKPGTGKEKFLNILYENALKLGMPLKETVKEGFQQTPKGRPFSDHVRELRYQGFLEEKEIGEIVFLTPCVGDNLVKNYLKDDDLFELYQLAMATNDQIENDNINYKYNEKNGFIQLKEKVTEKIQIEFSKNGKPKSIKCMIAIFWLLICETHKNEFTYDDLLSIFSAKIQAKLSANDFLNTSKPLCHFGFVVKVKQQGTPFYFISFGEEFETAILCSIINPTDNERLQKNYAATRQRLFPMANLHQAVHSGFFGHGNKYVRMGDIENLSLALPSLSGKSRT